MFSWYVLTWSNTNTGCNTENNQSEQRTGNLLIKGQLCNCKREVTQRWNFLWQFSRWLDEIYVMGDNWTICRGNRNSAILFLCIFSFRLLNKELTWACCVHYIHSTVLFKLLSEKEQKKKNRNEKKILKVTTI